MNGGIIMRLWKKALSLVLVSAMAFSMCACGGKKDEGSKKTDTFKIGGIGPTTGDAAIYGKAVQNGIQLAIDEINAAGGINGKKIEYKFQDDQNDTEKSVNAYNSLKDWGMQMLVGTVTSNPCTAVVEQTHNDNMFQLTPSATAVESIQYDNAFRMCFSDPNQGIASAEAFTADSKTDFSVQIQKAKSAGAEMVFLPIYYQEASLILAQAKKANFTPKYFGCDGMDGILALDGFDKSLAEDLMFLTPFTPDSKDDKTQTFVKAYKKAFKDTPIQFAADAYDCIYTINAAAEKAKLTPDMSISDMSDALKKSMTEIELSCLTAKSIKWSADGEPTKEPTVVVVKNGAYDVAE